MRKSKCSTRQIEQSHLLSFRVAVEIIRPDLFAKHHVVIEVNELLREPWDAVDVGLDSRGAEGGEVAVVQEDILQVRKKMIYIKYSKIIFKTYMAFEECHNYLDFI